MSYLQISNLLLIFVWFLCLTSAGTDAKRLNSENEKSASKGAFSSAYTPINPKTYENNFDEAVLFFKATVTQKCINHWFTSTESNIHVHGIAFSAGSQHFVAEFCSQLFIENIA
ncbi:hypothetical protein SDC9_79563 [bioreactor metagenome]|uniref:Uncharacterized protein n=1 Tax=bioreactor metagenome TaxID=1076179 RepID=A0A644YWS8_9ZZZZ